MNVAIAVTVAKMQEESNWMKTQKSARVSEILAWSLYSKAHQTFFCFGLA
jgi:hypothetical protein